MPIEPEAGSWYIIVVCDNCKSTVYLFRDLTEGTGSLNASYCVTCPRCLYKGEYQAQHYRHSPNPVRDLDHTNARRAKAE